MPQITITSSSANADRPHDTASCKIHHITLPTKYNYEAMSVVDNKLLADRAMSVITIYLNDNAQTPLNRFVVYMLYKKVCNKHGDKLN